jgi:hypothetical protein
MMRNLAWTGPLDNVSCGRAHDSASKYAELRSHISTIAMHSTSDTPAARLNSQRFIIPPLA